MDKLSKQVRSQNMAAIRAANTKPEMIVRRVAHGLGFRFRLHRRDLPGRPDLVFAKHRAVVFVHGCFWHLHPKAKCSDARIPKSNLEYWQPKLIRNVERDRQSRFALKRLGWRVLTIWECETKDADAVRRRLSSFLNVH